MSIGTSLKAIFYNLATSFVKANNIQIIASLAVSITVATTLLNKFDEYLKEVKGDFSDLKTLDFANYLMAFVDLAKLDVAMVNILTAISFALVWRFTYDLKPKSKISN